MISISNRKINAEDYEPDDFELEYRKEIIDYEHPTCPECGMRMEQVRRSIGTYGYYTDRWECPNCE